VKYRAVANGVVTVPFATCWADRHGVHSVPINKQYIDILCIYVPDTDRCYYVDPSSFRRSVLLRVEAPRNFQKKRIAWAGDYLEWPSTVRGVPAGSGPALEPEPNVRHSAAPRTRP
jgi:hypothetical protein